MTKRKKTEPEASGASAPEPSLVARIAFSNAESMALDRGLEPLESADANAGESAGQALREGSDSAPSTGRVDAAAATLGRHAGVRGSAAAGEGVSSVGGAQGDVPGSGVVDQPEHGEDAPQQRAGFLEGLGGRRGVATSEGEIYDDMGGSIRSIAEVAADSGSLDVRGDDDPSTRGQTPGTPRTRPPGSIESGQLTGGDPDPHFDPDLQ